MSVDDKPRVEPRLRSSINARLRGRDGEADCTVIDLSSRGLLGLMSGPPPRGEFVEVRIGQHVLVGHVRWRAGGRFGISLRERISVSALLGGGNAGIGLARGSARRPRGSGIAAAVLADSSALARCLQFAFVAVALGIAAWGISRLAANSLHTLAAAEDAMASRTQDK